MKKAIVKESPVKAARFRLMYRSLSLSDRNKQIWQVCKN